MRKRKWLLYIYYLLLLLLFLSWNDLERVPGTAIRIGYLAAVIIPCYFYDKKWLPAVMTLFITLFSHGLTSSYLPARFETYIVVLLVGLVLLGVGKHDKKTQHLIFFLLFYTTIINFVTSVEVVLISKTLLIVYILTFYIDFRDEESFKLLSLSLIISALSLSASLLINAEQVATVHGVSGIAGAERLGFRDINYTACVVALGLIAAMIEVVRRKSGPIVFMVSVITLAVSVIALAMNASRGSFLALALAGIIILWFSRTNKFYKILLTITIFIGLYFMYTNEMLDLLAARLTNDDGTGSNRLFIWKQKISDFSNQNILSWIFGMGHTNGRDFDLAQLHGASGFHNDFLAFWVCYGIIGLVAIIRLFVFPLRITAKHNKHYSYVIASLVGLFTICFTLEPFAAGRLPFYMFWIYLVWLSRLGESKIE